MPEKPNPWLDRPIADLKLTFRASNCLESAGISTVRDLVQRTPRNLLGLRGFGRSCLVEVQRRLRAIGLRLGDPPDEPDAGVPARI